MARWYSGVMPYRYLLPAQLIIIVLMSAMIMAVTNQAGPLGRPSGGIGVTTVVASYVYAPHDLEGRAAHHAATGAQGVVIPIVFTSCSPDSSMSMDARTSRRSGRT